jgi:hypothetical protein
MTSSTTANVPIEYHSTSNGVSESTPIKQMSPISCARNAARGGQAHFVQRMTSAPIPSASQSTATRLGHSQ